MALAKGHQSILEDSVQQDDVQLKLKRDQILEWMKKQPYLPDIPDDFARKMATFYLVGSKLRTEKAKTKIDLMYSLRHQLPEVFLELDPLGKEVQGSLETMYYVILPELTPEGNRVHIFVYGADKERLFNFQDLLGLYKRIVGVQLGLMLQEEFSNGEIFVLDMRGFRSSHLTELNWVVMKKFAVFTQEAMILSPKMILVINAPGFVETTLNIFKPILKEKIRNRIQILKGDHTSLHKLLPKRILPSDYGGDAPSLKECNSARQKSIESIRDVLLEDEKRITDELKRPNESMHKHSQTFGVNGTFTRLSID